MGSLMTLPHGWRRRTASAALAAMLAGGSLAGALLHRALGVRRLLAGQGILAQRLRYHRSLAGIQGRRGESGHHRQRGGRATPRPQGRGGRRYRCFGCGRSERTEEHRGQTRARDPRGHAPRRPWTRFGQSVNRPSSVAGVVSLVRFQCRPGRNRRRRARGPDPVRFHLARFAESRGARRTRNRFPKPSAGQWTTAPRSSIFPSAAHRLIGPRAGTRRSSMPNKRTWSLWPRRATGSVETSRWAHRPRFRVS